MSAQVQPEADLTLLVREINRIHTRIVGAKNALPDAIRAGELLAQIQTQVPKGEWIGWLQAHLDVHPTTAFGYMRLYRLRDQVLDDGGAPKYSGIDPALAALGESSLTPDVVAEMRRLHDSGVGLTEIAETFGVAKSTVWYHVNAKRRNQIKRSQREIRMRADQALEREQQRRELAKISGPLPTAYSHVRRALEALQKEVDGKLGYAHKAAVYEAMNALYRAEDAIVKAHRESAE